MRKTRALGVTILGGLAVAVGMWRGRLRRFEITEDSMAPALEEGDYVVATRLVSAPLRGDIVVFAHPTDPDFLMTKRVVGLPEETVTIRDGRVMINGRVLAEPWGRGALAGEAEWILDGRQLVVLSDNRSVPTADSRELGPLPIGDMWRVALRYWPADRIGSIK